MPRISKAQATANMQAAMAQQAAGITTAAPVANAPVVSPVSPTLANSTVVIPPPPPGMDQAVWNDYFIKNLASKTATTTRAPRGTASGIAELTIETAQKLHDAGNIAATVRAGKLGTVEILPTDGTEGCYSLALVQNGKVTLVEPAHVDRVKSPRHLPRALRLAGTWIGEHPDSGFQNGPTGKAVTTPANSPITTTPIQQGVALNAEEVKEVAATGSVQTPRAHVPTADEVAAALMNKAESIGNNGVGAGGASKKVTKNATKATKSTKSTKTTKAAAKKTTRR